MGPAVIVLVGVALGADPDAASCGACHTAVWEAWRTSRHAVSASNPVFTASWENWPNGWCLDCHAPRTEQQVDLLGAPAVAGWIRPPDPQGESWRDGVDCATCHVRDGAIVAARAVDAPHSIVVDPELGSEALCARCHEFPMQNHTPAWPFTSGSTLAQATVSEWQSSTAAAEGVGCVDCHLDGHRFPGAHAPDLVRDALHAEVVAQADGTLRVTVSATGAAHQVPTGDPFRRLVIEACGDPGCAMVLASQTLRRVFQADATSWTVYADRTVPAETHPGAATRVLALSPTSAAIWWRLSLRFGDARFESDLPPEEVGYVVAEGPVTLESP